jgi:hypothetical protein
LRWLIPAKLSNQRRVIGIEKLVFHCLTWESTGVVEYVVPGDWLGGADVARWAGNPGIDFVAGSERNWSNTSGREYTQWRVGLVFKTGWRL